MEMDLIRRLAMDLPFRLGKPAKCLDRLLLYPGDSVARLDHRANIRKGSMRMLMPHVDVKLDGLNP